MAMVLTKHFQYAGTDDFDQALDTQINEFFAQEGIKAEDIVNIQYEGHSALGVNTYSALLVYRVG